MAHYFPGHIYKCEGKSCRHCVTHDDGKDYCSYMREIAGYDTLTSQVVSCPKCM